MTDSVNRKPTGVHKEAGCFFSFSSAAAAAAAAEGDQLTVSKGSCATSAASVMGNAAARVLQPGCLCSPLSRGNSCGSDFRERRHRLAAAAETPQVYRRSQKRSQTLVQMSARETQEKNKKALKESCFFCFFSFTLLLMGGQDRRAPRTNT